MGLGDLVLYLMTGALTGLLAGILGIGGGIIVVPALLYIFEHQDKFQAAQIMHVAVATSLAIMVLTTQAAVRAHLRLSTISYDTFHKLWPGLAFGTMMGVVLAGFLPTFFLRVLFALFLIFSAFKISMYKPRLTLSHFPSKGLNTGVMALIGLNSGLLGVGGGTLIIPYLVHCGLKPRAIPPLTGLCTLLVSVLATCMFIILSVDVHDMPKYSSGYIYWPAVFSIAIPSMFAAPLGARLMYKLPRRQLQNLFVALLLLIALDILLKSIF